MANCRLLLPFILRWEGGFVNDPDDRGGATNKGVTLAVWQKYGYDKNGDGVIDVSDLKAITDEDVLSRILKPQYWDRWKADYINSQPVANILVDWVWCSGTNGIKIPQRVLGVTADGAVGKQTLAAVNAADPEDFFNRIKAERIAFVTGIAERNSSQKKFLKGWLNRINALTY